MNDAQMTEYVINTTKEIAALWESAKSAHKRIDENDQLTAGIHKLAQSIAAMSTEIKLLTERMDKSIERIEQGQKAQGERIGNIEKAILTINRNEKTIEEHEKRLDKIDNAPADKWNKFTWLIFTGVVTAVVAFLVGKFL